MGIRLNDPGRVIRASSFCIRQSHSIGGFILDFSVWTQPSALGTFAAWFIVSFLYAGMGITLGYHRLLTHKGLKVPRWVMYFWVSGGYLALMGAPISWVATHRLHHQKSDQPGDPHSPRDGFEHALYKWMMNMEEKQDAAEVARQCPDLMTDPVLRMLGTSHNAKQAQLCLAINIAWRVGILLLFGQVAFVANLLAGFIVFWSPQFVNTFCHLKEHGYRNFDVRDDSRNVWWVAMLACGEGWHNNHHAFPKSARHGMKWWEFDVTWCTIWLMEKLGLAKEVVRPNATAVEAATAKAALSKKVEPVDQLGEPIETVKAEESKVPVETK